MSFRNYYDTSTYGRSRGDTSRTSSSHGAADRPTTVTAKYINPTTPSYKSSSIPILCRDRSSTRENESPITTIANRYANYKTAKDDKPATKYEKKDTYKLSVPTITTNRSRDVSPVSTASKYNLTRTSRHMSPERRGIKSTSSLSKCKSRDPSPTDRDKDIPSKTDKSSSYNILTHYKSYPRASNYIRPSSRAETKPEILINRFGTNRLSSSSNYLRTPSSEKSRASISPVNHTDTPKIGTEQNISKAVIVRNEPVPQTKETPVAVKNDIVNGEHGEAEDETENITVITRHTSPTPPGSSVYVRTRRADMAKTVEKTIIRSKKRPQMIDKQIQSDRLDDPTRTSKFGSTARASTSNWSTYTSGVNNYTGYAGRFSTQYGNIRDHSTNSCCEKSNMRSTESEMKETSNSKLQTDKISPDSRTGIDVNGEQNCDLNTFNNTKANDASEIIINVNLKLKKTNTSTAAELVSPEVTITNCQLPPQAPKSEGLTKTKKVKVRKSSTDSSSDSSKKKVRRSKSISSAESDQGSDTNSNEKCKDVNPNHLCKGVQKNGSFGNFQKSVAKLKHSSKSRESNSPESSLSLSTQSSISEDENISKGKIIDASRTSADDTSLSIDRSVKQSSPIRSETGQEEAKSFLIRALAPVTNLFKTRHQDSNDNSKWLENSTSESTGKDVSNLITESDRSSKSKHNTDNIIATNDDNVIKLRGIRQIDSDEPTRQLNSDSGQKGNSVHNDNQKSPSEKNIPKRIRHIESGERAWWLESNSESKKENHNTHTHDSTDSNKFPKKCKFVNLGNEEKPWWLDSCANIPEGIERLTPPRKTSCDSDKSEKYDFYKVRRIESGEKDWWISSESASNNAKDGHSASLTKSGSDQRSFPLRRIRHIESGERPWWLSSSKNIPEGIEKLPTPPPQEDSDSSESEELQVYVPLPQKIPPFPLNLPDDEPLGDRKSPEGLETPRESENYPGRRSPYENGRQFRKNNNTIGYQRPSDKYISRYTDIDDILGTSGQIYSPFMDSILARRTGQMQFDDSECEEIDPTQVRIHDSTAQRPVIKKLPCRSEIVDYCEGDQLDDAALQVFKDGDYGSYLDLDSTLAEQEEDLEGLQENRKNAIVLRTQLSVRVHAIIERLISSQGRELRRALFTLKQILQSDKDLVHEFVANKGLDCLMQVGNMADHNYLDYILRALGQIFLYVDGMHGVMEHKRCIHWLYSLIASKYRHVVKTALKLLLVFVEYTEKNSLLLIDAIRIIDVSKGRQPWYNVMQILQDFEAADGELLIYATTLINRCLNNLPDIDTYYDQVDALQDQGIEETIQVYMSKPGTDLDLLRQLQIFEAVLVYEDGEDNGTSGTLLDESIMNSVRRRSLTLNTSERRKSKKYQLKEKGNQKYTSGLKQRIQQGTLGHSLNALDALTVIRQKHAENGTDGTNERNVLVHRENSIKEIANKLIIPTSPNGEDKPSRLSDMAGIVSKAKEELAKSQSKELIKSPTKELAPKIHEIKLSENDLHWEELKKGCVNRAYFLCDLDFSELRQDSDDDFVSPILNYAGVPPPPPPALFPSVGAPPPPPGMFPFPKNNIPAPPLKSTVSTEQSNDSDSSTIKKNKKTVKLFWKEVQEVPLPPSLRTKVKGSFWDYLPDVQLDTKILEHLFESRTNDLVIKEKTVEPKRHVFLDAKRSNAINIAMKKLPTPQSIKNAILKMDATAIGREGIEKLFSLLPTEEEKAKINEVQSSNPGLPLGSAEQFLMTLGSISEVGSRLKLWVFKLDFENLEKEIAEPLMDLMLGIEVLKTNKTFKIILSTLRSVGSFLNGSQVKGFRLEYLSKVVEVKDTVHKHPLMHHICDMIIEKFPDSSDLFSELGPVIRASKVDFDMVNTNLSKLESDCKASWDHLKKIAKHDGSQIFKTKITDFLTDAAERTILLGIIRKRVMARYNKFLVYLGVPPVDLDKSKPSDFLKNIAEFALEYRTARERTLNQLEKKANHRERNKTRGKMIIDVGNFTSKNAEKTADNALTELLKNNSDTNGTMEGRKKSKPARRMLINDESADEEIIESLVRSSTTQASSKRRAVPRERRNRISDRKNLNRTLDGNQSWPGRDKSPNSKTNILA